MKVVICCNAIALMKLAGTATTGLLVLYIFKDAAKYSIVVQYFKRCMLLP